jgi:large subunit ribosomal protein L6
MSRVGKAPVFFDKAVTVTVGNTEIVVKGAKTSQRVPLMEGISAKIADGAITLARAENGDSAKFGLIRALLQNAVTGVSKGWVKELDLNGVGYRANVAGKKLDLSLGYSHPISFDIPEGIEIKVEKQTKIIITGADRSRVGQVAAQIRDFRPPEPYLGKGIKYSDEVIRRKAGKAAGK